MKQIRATLKFGFTREMAVVRFGLATLKTGVGSHRESDRTTMNVGLRQEPSPQGGGLCR